MLRLNDAEIPLKHFTDGTPDLRVDVPRDHGSERSAVITWLFENDAETVALIFLTRHLQEHGIRDIDLVMPYIPNARMDRVKTDADVFTLKYFAEVINALHFRSVRVLDPHSAVSEALIDRIVIKTAKDYILEAVRRINDKDLMLFFPDEGAMKRYSDMCDIPFAYGQKNRDWETREIRGLTVCGDVGKIAGKSILMVDDICSSGRTLHYSAKKLKELGAGKIFLYVSHCENIVTESELLHSEMVERVFTTRSFLKLEHSKFEILDSFTEV
ncbi:MAG: ribose-phosphate pyrophosphokinase [Clostridia bacterium]|nr:ribose-phosphate pyrophosphokinase [Clostridia bacterium]